MYPHLRQIEIQVSHRWQSWDRPLSKQQLQQLCSCCPAVEGLGLALSDRHNLPAPAWLPLQHLSALTQLTLFSGRPAAAAAAVKVAAQLTRLKDLTVRGVPKLTDRCLTGLTDLTALEDSGLRVIERENTSVTPELHLRKKVSHSDCACWHTRICRCCLLCRS
jgi:hypothetical protein